MALNADIIKEEDTYRWQPTLENPRTGTTYDLTNATEVRLYVDHLRSDTLVVNSAVEIVDAANGEVAYDFSRAETARAGTHRAEFVVEETDGDYVTVPNDGYVKLDFTAMLPRGADLEPATADTDATVATLTATDWIESPVARLDSVATESLPNVADHVVSTKSELQSAFSNVAAGESIYIGNENAPYRTDQWLDLDVGGVRVVGAGDEPLIKPADGAEVGGIRVGQSAHVENVIIENVSFDGNPAGQTDTTIRKDGIIVNDVKHVTVKNCHVANTHAQAVSDGTTEAESGNGIDVRPAAEDVLVEGCTTVDCGYDGIRMLGTRMMAVDNITIGQDNRGISGSDNGTNGATRFVVDGNICETGPLTASAIAQRYNGGEVIATDNITFTRAGENGRRGLQFTNISDVAIVGNYVYGSNLNDHAILVDCNRALVSSNIVQNPAGGYGIYHGSRNDVIIANNIVKDARNGNGGIRVGGSDRAACVGNIIENPVGNGISVDGGSYRSVTGNVIKSPTEHGIYLDSLLTDFTVSGNIVYNPSLSASNTYDGIHVDATRGLVGSNYVNGNANARDGVRVATNAGSVSIVGNRAENVNGQNFNLDFTKCDADANTPAPTFDLTATSAPTRVVFAYHDGTDGTSANAEGPAFSPSGSSTWTSVVDGGTIA